MKSLVGALAVLFLVTTFAMAEGYQPLPFPQAANPALANATAGSESSLTGDLPSSMAANQSSDESMGAKGGSPFPSVANPAHGANSSDQSTPALQDQHALGSPFPSDASPSNQ